MRNEVYSTFGNTDVDKFIKKQGWSWFSNIHGIQSYIAEDTYTDNDKVYNFVVRKGHFFVKHKNGLKVYRNDSGYFVNTSMGRVYINGIIDGVYNIPISGK